MPTGLIAAAGTSGSSRGASLDRLGDDLLLGLFVSERSEAAFEELVGRHGPRVLGVCRQILRRPQDAEDVFQATFLLLARKAATIRKGESVGHWLHGVAHRLAVRSKTKASRRGEVEGSGQGGAMAISPPEDDLDRREVRRIVHEEIDRLPERLRQPILLCYLEGHSNEAAARFLGCPSSTLKERLAKGREVLHGRLARRGIALTVALLLLLLPRTAPADEVSFRLVRSTVDAAMAASGRKRSSRGPLPPGWPLGFLPMVALSMSATFASATTALYLASPARIGLLTWFLGAVRRACH